MLIQSNHIARPPSAQPSAPTGEVKPEGVQGSGDLTTDHVGLGKTTNGSPVDNGLPEATGSAADPDATMEALRSIKPQVSMTEIMALVFTLSMGLKKANNEAKWSETMASVKENQAEADSMKVGALKTLIGAIAGGLVSIGGGAFGIRGAAKQLSALSKVQAPIKVPAMKIEALKVDASNTGAPKVDALKVDAPGKLELTEVDMKLAAAKPESALNKAAGDDASVKPASVKEVEVQQAKADEVKNVKTQEVKAVEEIELDQTDIAVAAAKGKFVKGDLEVEAPEYRPATDIEVKIKMEEVAIATQRNQAIGQSISGVGQILQSSFSFAGELEQAKGREHAAQAGLRTAFGQQAEAAANKADELTKKMMDGTEQMLQTLNQTELAVIRNTA